MAGTKVGMENLNLRKHSLLPWTLRGGAEADFLQCSELWMSAIALRDGTPNDVRMKDRALAKLGAPGSILQVAETGADIQGFVLAAEKTVPGLGRTAHLSLLAVKPAYQAQGLGRSLLVGLTQTLAREGFTGATLAVLEDNLGARKIYEAASWQVTGGGFFEDSGRPCVYYSLDLQNRTPN